MQPIDLDGVFYGSRAALPHLQHTKGCIVNTASVSGLGGDWNLSFYNAAKGGVVNLTRSLALDYGRDGVRVNAVCPSLTRTDLTADMFKDEALLQAFRDRIALALAEHKAKDQLTGLGRQSTLALASLGTGGAAC